MSGHSRRTRDATGVEIVFEALALAADGDRLTVTRADTEEVSMYMSRQYKFKQSQDIAC